MKKILIKLLNKIGLYTYDQVYDEVVLACDLIAGDDERISTYDQQMYFKDRYVNLYNDFKEDQS